MLMKSSLDSLKKSVFSKSSFSAKKPTGCNLINASFIVCAKPKAVIPYLTESKNIIQKPHKRTDDIKQPVCRSNFMSLPLYTVY